MVKLYIFLVLFISGSQAGFAQCLDIGKRQVAKELSAPHFFNIISIDAADCSSIEFNGNATSFILRSDTQKIHNGVRAEVAVDYPFNEGEQVTYQVAIKLPKDFKADFPQNRWWLVVQWHDQPDKRVNETWRDFPALSPPVAVYVEARNGIPGIGLIMFGKDKKSWAPYPLGQWLTLNFQISWSTYEDGLVNFKVLEYPEFSTQVNGRNMNNSYQHYLKFGQYRHTDIKVNSSVLFKNLNISK